MSRTYFTVNRPELESREDPMIPEHGIELTPRLWPAKTPSRPMRHFPDIQSILVDNWTKTISANILKRLEQNEDIAELKDKVDNLSSDLESLKNELVSCRGCIDKLYSEFIDRPIIKKTELFDITAELEVIEPIPIVIEETEDEVVASFPEVEVFAVGAGEAEAINNLKREITKLFYELIDTPDEQLGRVPRGWKRVFDKVVKKVEQTQRI